MNREQIEMAFEKRLPVYAKIDCVSSSGMVIAYSNISAVIRRWSEKQGREILELELCDEPGRSRTVALPEKVFLSMEEALGKVDPETREFETVHLLVQHYERYLKQPATSTILEGFEYYLRQGMEADVIKRIIEYACEINKKSWYYINAVIIGKLKRGIKTLEAYKEDEKRWEESKRAAPGLPQSAKPTAPSRREPMRSKFNNYNDTNKPDYSGFGEQILKDMLESSG